MKTSVRTYLLALLLPFLFAGCINEDMSRCSTGLQVYITYSLVTDVHTGIDPSEVQRLDLFLFDAQGVFCGRWTDTSPTLGPNYNMTISAPSAGEYRLIVWGCIYGCYSTVPTDFVPGKTTFDEAFVTFNALAVPSEGGAMPLFYADKREYLRHQGVQKVYLPLRQEHNTINLTTEGLLANGDTYRLSVHDNNGKFRFDESFADCSDFTYATPCRKTGQGQLLASLNVLRLAADRHTVLEVTNETQGTIIYRENFIKLINTAGGIDYNLVHKFDVHLRFGLDVSVSINGWDVVEEGNFLN